MILMFFLSCSQSFSNAQKSIVSSSEKTPIEVAVTLHVNKIYNFNLVDETYQIDGYLLYSWNDKSVCKWYTQHIKSNPNDSLSNSIVYENERAEYVINNEVSIPVFELMNVHGDREAPNKRIELFPDGTIEYEERFFAMFNSDMDYRPFPFDTQKYLIEIEAFSYDSSQLVFKESNLFPKLTKDNRLGGGWEIVSQKDTIALDRYSYSQNDNDDRDEYYSKVTFTIEATRVSGYYVWQVLFPLFIIILASFTVFWIDDLSTQIGVGFTLMLTVVAFNFYSASILPVLPYNTFIEYVIIVGYIFIFLSILAIILLTYVNKSVCKIDLLKHFRYAFPVAYSIIMVLLYYNSIGF